jgi:nucleoside-diphosphate-sugar epimerase
MPAPDLVTGGSGYFGSLLVRQLRAHGRAVRIFDLNDADDRPAEVEFFQGDIRDAAAVRRACDGCAAVYHNVAMVPLAKDKSAFWSVNEGGTRVLLEACRETGVKKVVYTSSSAVYGAPPKNPVDDDTPLNPGEEYGRAKLAGEELCRQFSAAGLDVSIIRPRTIMGHGRLGIMQILFEWIRRGMNIPVLGKGDNLYQFVHADDLADACVRAAARPGPAAYNIGAASFGTMRETLDGLIAHAKTGSRVVSLPMAPAVALMKLTSALGLSPLGAYHSLMYGRSMYFDISRAQRELGWTPRYDNVEMFRQSYDWYLANREAILAARGMSHHRSPVDQGALKIVGWILRLR